MPASKSKAADAKGATKSSVHWVKGTIDESGCSGTPVTLRSDQEEAIMALKRHVAVYRKAETVMLESPVRDSKANGAAERAVRSWGDNSGQSDITLKGESKQQYRRIRQ